MKETTQKKDLELEKCFSESWGEVDDSTITYTPQIKKIIQPVKKEKLDFKNSYRSSREMER